MFWLRNKTVNYLVHNYNKSPDTCHCKLIFTYRFVCKRISLVTGGGGGGGGNLRVEPTIGNRSLRLSEVL